MMENILNKKNRNIFEIYQLRREENLRYFRFESTESLKRHGLSIERENYNLIYSGFLTEADSLNSIYIKFNENHPEDFTGHSLSVSDIIVIHRDGVSSAHYIDDIGFQEIPHFLEPQNEISFEKIEKLNIGDTVYLMNGHVALIDKEQSITRNTWEKNLSGSDVSTGELRKFNHNEVECIGLINKKDIYRNERPLISHFFTILFIIHFIFTLSSSYHSFLIVLQVSNKR